MERIFAGMWLAACRVDQIAARGDFVRRDVAGASVLIVGDGEAGRARFTTCADIAARGSVRSTSGRVCRQHPVPVSRLDLRSARPSDWRAADGRSRGVRARGLSAARGRCARSGTATSSSTCQTRRRRWPPSLETCPRGSRRGACASFAAVHIASSTHVKANWKLIVQNYNECLHCPIIHPLLNRMHHYLGAANVPSTGTYCGGAMGFKDGVETLSVDGRRRRAPLPGLGAAEQQLVNYFAIYPNLLLTLHPDYMLTVTIWPQSAGSTRVSSASGTSTPTRSPNRTSCIRTPSSSGTSPIARTGRFPSDRSRASRHAATRQARTRSARASCGSSIVS